MIFPKHNARLNFTGYHPLCPPKATPRKSQALRTQGWGVVWSGLALGKEARKLSKLKEQYPVTAHAPNFDFWTGCPEIKRCEESKRTLKNPFASRLAEFNTTLKLLRITDQWYIVPVKFRFGQNLDFLALLLLPLAGGPKDGKRFDADWRLISSASFHTSSDNCERNTQKWNSNNKDCKKETIEKLMWLRRFCAIKLCEEESFVTTR